MIIATGPFSTPRTTVAALVAIALVSVAIAAVVTAHGRLFAPAFALLPLLGALLAGISPSLAGSLWLEGVADILDTALLIYGVTFFEASVVCVTRG